MPNRTLGFIIDLQKHLNIYKGKNLYLFLYHNLSRLHAPIYQALNLLQGLLLSEEQMFGGIRRGRRRSSQTAAGVDLGGGEAVFKIDSASNCNSNSDTPRSGVQEDPSDNSNAVTPRFSAGTPRVVCSLPHILSISLIISIHCT